MSVFYKLCVNGVREDRGLGRWSWRCDCGGCVNGFVPAPEAVDPTDPELLRERGWLLITDGEAAAKDRLIAHAQLLGFDEFDDPALADEYATELLHAAIGEG